MSEPAWTPGPWTAIDAVVVITFETHGYSTWLANFAVGGGGQEAHLANAQLAAAAPELYGALRRVYDECDGVDRSHLASTVMAALAKARGEQP